MAPDILKEKEVQQERRDRKRELEGVPDKWLRKEWKESRGGFSCLHCGSDAHKAFECPMMLDEAKEKGAEQLPTTVKRLAGCWLFCRLCFEDNKGNNMTDQAGKKHIAIGWGNHTVQKCKLHSTGIDPSRPEKMPAKKSLRRQKVKSSQMQIGEKKP